MAADVVEVAVAKLVNRSVVVVVRSRYRVKVVVTVVSARTSSDTVTRYAIQHSSSPKSIRYNSHKDVQCLQ